MAREYDIRPPSKRTRKKWSDLSRAYKLSLARKYDTRPKSERRKSPLFTLPARDRVAYKKPEYRTPTERRYSRTKSAPRRAYKATGDSEYERLKALYEEEARSGPTKPHVVDNKPGYDYDTFKRIYHPAGYTYHAVYTVAAGNYASGAKSVYGPVENTPKDLMDAIETDLDEREDIISVRVYVAPSTGVYDPMTYPSLARYPTEETRGRVIEKSKTKRVGNERWIRYGENEIPYKRQR